MAPEAAVRFLHAIGYEEFAPMCVRQQINLTMLTEMTMLDLERDLGMHVRPPHAPLSKASSLTRTRSPLSRAVGRCRTKEDRCRPL
jgi:hypothetical protein